MEPPKDRRRLPEIAKKTHEMRTSVTERDFNRYNAIALAEEIALSEWMRRAFVAFMQNGA